MKLTGVQAADVVYGDTDEWSIVEPSTLIGHDRWSVGKTVVARHVETGRFYRFDYTVGATEMQDETPYQNDDEYEPVEVRKVEKVVTAWVVVS